MSEIVERQPRVAQRFAECGGRVPRGTRRPARLALPGLDRGQGGASEPHRACSWPHQPGPPPPMASLPGKRAPAPLARSTTPNVAALGARSPRSRQQNSRVGKSGPVHTPSAHAWACVARVQRRQPLRPSGRWRRAAMSSRSSRARARARIRSRRRRPARKRRAASRARMCATCRAASSVTTARRAVCPRCSASATSQGGREGGVAETCRDDPRGISRPPVVSRTTTVFGSGRSIPKCF